jgi:hypothetical protein
MKLKLIDLNEISILCPYQWKKLHKGELYDLYSLSNIVRVIKSRTPRWVEYMAYMAEIEMCTKLWLENLKGRDHLGDKCRWQDNIKMDFNEIGCGLDSSD